MSSSNVNPYEKPLQPPPVTNTRSLSSSFPSSWISSNTLSAARADIWMFVSDISPAILHRGYTDISITFFGCNGCALRFPLAPPFSIFLRAAKNMRLYSLRPAPYSNALTRTPKKTVRTKPSRLLSVGNFRGKLSNESALPQLALLTIWWASRFCSDCSLKLDQIHWLVEISRTSRGSLKGFRH